MVFKMPASFNCQTYESGHLGPPNSVEPQLNEATLFSAVEEAWPAIILLRNNKSLSIKALTFVVVY